MGPSKMAAIEISWLHFSNNRSSIQSFLEISDIEAMNKTPFCVERNTYLVEIPNNNGPETESCGTPISTFPRVLH